MRLRNAATRTQRNAYQLRQLAGALPDHPRIIAAPSAQGAAIKVKEIMDRTHILRALLCVGTSAFALTASPAAFAQQAQRDSEEIIVTAQRRPPSQSACSS